MYVQLVEDLAQTLLDLHRAVAHGLLAGVRRIVVDTSAIGCLSSTTLTALLWAQRRCRARGGSVIVRNPSAKSTELLIRTGLWEVLEIEAGAPVRSPAGQARS